MNHESNDIRGSEAERLRRVKQQVEEAGAGWSEPYKPGTFGCHEVLDRTSTLADQVERLVVDHPSILLDPEWFALADTALTALNDLYHGSAYAPRRRGGEPANPSALRSRGLVTKDP